MKRMKTVSKIKRPRRNSQITKLRKLRLAAGLTLREVATQAKVSIARLHALETNSKANVELNTVRKLARFYETTMEALFN